MSYYLKSRSIVAWGFVFGIPICHFLSLFQFWNLNQYTKTNSGTPISIKKNNTDITLKHEALKTSILEESYAPTLVEGPHGSCRLRNTTISNEQPLKQALARFFIFQRNKGRKLNDILAYYSSVVPLDHLVIIDHESDDALTSSILDYYAKSGAYVWRCERSENDRNYNWGQFKAEMLSRIIRVYKHRSDFVFPLDDDEYLMVIKPDPNNEGKSLHWNAEDLNSELRRLLETDEKGRANRPFKMSHGYNVPLDCKVKGIESKNGAAVHKYLSKEKFTSELCFVQGLVYRNQAGCPTKSFVLGTDFVKTDVGNHYGFTRQMSDMDIRRECKTRGRIHPDARTNFALIHIDEIDFDAWLSKTIDRASSRNFNNMAGYDCTNSLSVHYCERWNSLVRYNFKYDVLRQSFVDKNEHCRFDLGTIYSSIENNFGALC